MSEYYYSTDGGLTVHPIGEVKEIFISEPTQEVDYLNINLQSETISMSLTLRRRDKKTWGRIFQMPKYKVTEWMFPKKKKRGSKRRARYDFCPSCGARMETESRYYENKGDDD